MPIDELQSPAIAEERAELDAVLASPSFVRAPALAHLLAYLCEALFRGDSSSIKEYSIACEVFHRGPNFDPETDSIVRVEANRLRKHLADFYSTGGASHNLRIVIPVGQYVPRFDRPPVATPPAENETRLTGRMLKLLQPPARRLWISLAVLLPLLILAYALFRARSHEPSPVPESATATQLAESTVGPPPGQEVRILSGSTRSFVDHAGKLWAADAWFTGGAPVQSAVRHIARTQDEQFYRTSREGTFRYDIPLQQGVYELRLHFAETQYGPESAASGGEGSRIMTVRANGAVLLSGFDVVSDAGGASTADVKVFPGVVPAADGLLHLEFAPQNGRQATLSAIEILPGFKGRIRPVRVLARQTPYYSNDSQWWSPDNYFQGGQLAGYATPVNGADDPELFETERWGHFTYAIPVAPGRYSVTLYFAIRRGSWNQTPNAAQEEPAPPVAHVFNVFCNGRLLLGNFDLPAEAGKSDIVIRRFNGLEANAQDKLDFAFVPVRGYATITGIEVLPQ